MNQSQVTSILRRLNFLERNSTNVEVQPRCNLTIEPQPSINIEPVVEPVEEKDCCPICIDEITTNNLVTLRCGHSLHLTCYTTMISMPVGRRCPLCRSFIQENNNNQPNVRSRINRRNRRNRRYENPGYEIPDLGRDLEELDIEDENNFNSPYNRSQRTTLCMEQILTVMGHHALPIEVINHRITRSGRTIPYAIQTIRNNLNLLMGTGAIVRIGNDYLKIVREF